MATYYTVPPPGYDRYQGYSTSTSTSPAPEEFEYYPSPYTRASPNQGSTRSKRHVRTTSYTPPRVSVWSAHPPLGGQPQYYTASSRYASPSGKPDVSFSTTRPRRASTADRGIDFVEIGPDGRPRRRNSVRLPTRRIFLDPSDDASSDDAWDQPPQPIYQTVRPRYNGKTTTTRKASADSRRAQTSEVESASRSRARRASTTSRPKPPVMEKKSSREPVPATSADAARCKIPTGYVLKNWDPQERPILLLGSVFDANSLGKWIYDWTVYTHHAGSPLAEMAGELWLMLIKFSHKMKRAEEATQRVKGRDNRQMLADFQESGDRLWRRLLNLLKVCEDFMWRVAKRGTGKAQMGPKSGVEFVKTIFGRDRELEETERLMSSVRLWLNRFDANCEDILRSRRSRE
jgi:hypothetical protein